MGLFTPTWPARVVRRGHRGNDEPIAVLWCKRGHQLAQVFLAPGEDGKARALGFVREPAAKGVYRTVALDLGYDTSPPAATLLRDASCPCSVKPVAVPHLLLWTLLDEQVSRDPDGQGHANLRRVAAFRKRHALE